MAKQTSRDLRAKRHRRIRKRVHGTAQRPRLCVYRSNIHIYAQIIDDVAGHTLVSASTIDRAGRESLPNEAGMQRKRQQAHAVGKLIAERALQAGISEVVFDRGGYIYHGRVRAVADGAREGGLKF